MTPTVLTKVITNKTAKRTQARIPNLRTKGVKSSSRAIFGQFSHQDSNKECGNPATGSDQETQESDSNLR